MAKKTETQAAAGGQVFDEPDDFEFGNTSGKKGDEGDEGADDAIKVGDEYLVDGKKAADGSYETEDGSKVTVKDGKIESYEPLIEPFKPGDLAVGEDGKPLEPGDYKQEDGSVVTIKDGKVEKVTPSDSDVDPFVGAGQEQSQQSTADINYIEIAKKSGIDLKENTEEAYIKAINNTISSSKSEFKLDDYNDDAKAFIKHLNKNGGSVEDFLNNKEIIQMQAVIAQDPETKVRQVMIGEKIRDEKLPAEEAETAVDEEMKKMSTRQIRDMANEIDEEAKKIINTEMKTIVGDKSKKAEEEQQRVSTQVKKERDSMVEYINKRNDYLGIKLTAEAKAIMVRDIQSGEFDKIISKDNTASKFNSYIHARFGDNILKQIEKERKKSNQDGFNQATIKTLKVLHGVPQQGSAQSSGHTPPGRPGTKKNFDAWADMSLIGEDEG